MASRKDDPFGPGPMAAEPMRSPKPQERRRSLIPLRMATGQSQQSTADPDAERFEQPRRGLFRKDLKPVEGYDREPTAQLL